MKFELNELEISRAKEFCLLHDKKHGYSLDTFGFRYSYIFDVSSVYNFVSIRCGSCPMKGKI